MSMRKDLEKMEPLAGRDHAQGVIAVAQYIKKIVAGVVDPMFKDAKAYLAESHMNGGDRAQAYLDGQEVATISRTKDGEDWKITDELAYAKWLEENTAERDVLVLRPSPRVLETSYLALLRKQLEGTGEVPDGVEITDKPGYITVRISDKQRAAIESMGALTGFNELIEMVAIEGSETNK